MPLSPLVPRLASLALVAWACHATALAQDAAPLGAAESTYDLPARPVPSLDFGPPATLRPLAPRPIVYPPGTFRSPVAHPLRLSGTFGELRANHFHMGLDIKSAHQAVGDPLFSVADGYVSRLKVSAFGYGNSMYVDHPNGTRAVYAHLDAFPPHIQRYLDSVHYARESFEIEVRLSPKRFPIRAGEPIGVMGNTGSSQGPHLHFELRLVANDAAFNPLLFDFPVSDHQAPSLRGLSIYAVDDLARAPRQVQRLSPKPRGANQYALADTVTVPPGRIAFGLKAYDHQEGTSNLNGVFRIECRVDSATVWRTTFDTIAFEETRYIQAEYDFPARIQGQGYYYRLHRLPGNALRLADVAPADGTVSVGFGESRRVEIDASDPFGNTATLSFVVRGDTARTAVPQRPYSFVVTPDAEAVLELGDARFIVPRGAVYADSYLPAQIKTPTWSGALSSCYDLGDDTEPLHRAVEVTLPLDAVPDSLRGKAYLGRCGGSSRGRAMPTELSKDRGYLIGSLGDWTAFALFVDTVAPTVRPVSRTVYTLDDDVSSARALRYRVTQGGRWLLASYDAKRARLELRADRLDGTPISIEVWDEAGNRTAWPRATPTAR